MNFVHALSLNSNLLQISREGPELAGDEMDFGTELRGYRKEDVDRAIQDLRRELLQANSERTESAKEIKRLSAVAEDLQAELDETGTPTYAGPSTTSS